MNVIAIVLLWVTVLWNVFHTETGLHGSYIFVGFVLSVSSFLVLIDTIFRLTTCLFIHYDMLIIDDFWNEFGRFIIYLLYV